VESITMYRAEDDSVGEDSDDDMMDYDKDDVDISVQSKQRYDSGESGVFSSSSVSCPCGCGKEWGGCVSRDSGKESSETDSCPPSSLYIPSSYITNKLSQVSSSVTCSLVTRDNEAPLDMSKTSSTYQTPSISSKRVDNVAGQRHRDLFPGLYLLVDTALAMHQPRHLPPIKG
jgi:hypothetical protein